MLLPRHRRRPRRWAVALLVSLVAATAPAVVLARTDVLRGEDGTEPVLANGAAASVVARYRARIPELLAEQGIPGLAVALVDKDRALWVEGFGHLDGRGSAPVNGDTIFGVQSMSKLFTATAVMQAVAAGRLELDEPITTYLPGFTVRSAFEAQPERKITLRMLLGHTAGFTHEAPVGNNNQLDPGTFDAHVRSISETWLRFPVGSGYAYSNLGVDLAGAILARVEGRPFPDVLRDSLLEPLGMERSTFDRRTILSAHNRAVGHVEPYPEPPLDVPMTAAGGLYSSAADLARFLRFQLADGSIDGRVLLDPKWLDEQRTVPPPRAAEPAGYALGVVRHRWNRWDQRPDLFDHGGGGYGFLSDLWWSPPLGIGIAVLTNSQDHHLQGELALSILTDLVGGPGVYRDRLRALPYRPPIADPDSSFDPPPGMDDLVADAGTAATGGAVARWADYAGLYRAPAWDVIDLDESGRFVVDERAPYFEIDDGTASVRFRLVEIEPGLFLAANGETLDLRGDVLTWGNLRIVRVSGGPSSWQWTLLGAGALLAFAWLVAALVRSVRRVVRPRSGGASEHRRWRRLTATVAGATALVLLAAVALLAWKPALVDAGFVGWLEFSLAERLALHLPLAVAGLGASTAALVGYGWIGRWWPRGVTLQYTALAVASGALAALLGAWDLIGWGFT